MSLKMVDSTLAELVGRVELRGGVKATLSIQGLDSAVVTSVQLSVADGSTTSDFTLYIENAVSIKKMMELVQPEQPESLPLVVCDVDGVCLFRHRLSYLAKNIAYGAAAYTARGTSDEILLQKRGTVDFNNPPYDKQWSAQEMIKTVLQVSGSGIVPIFFFQDFEVLHITDFYDVPYADMLTDLLSGMPISTTFVSDSGGTKMYFVDPIHKQRFSHKIRGNIVTSLSASISYIPPQERSW